MKWRGIKILAVSAVLGTSVPVMALAATNGVNGFSRAAITLDGKAISNPYKTVANDGSNMTTYMPLYYLEQALTKAGYKSTWDGKTHTWTLTLTSRNVDLSNLQVGSGNTSITVNGKLVKKINTIVRRDPAGGSHGMMTTYVPIYYVEPLLQAVGVKNAWDGQSWAATSPITLATVSSTFGPATGTKSVSQNLVITGDGVTVQNTKVDGNIYVDPGANGTVHLNNVTVTGSIVVLSGAQQSVDLNNVNAQTLEINSASPVHIVSSGTTSIVATVVASDESQGVSLDQQAGSFGNVAVASASSVTLAGSTPFTGLTVSGSGTLTVGSGVTVANLNITSSKITVNISAGATVTSLTVSKNVSSASIVNNGTVAKLQNDASSSGVSLSGTGTVSTTTGNAPTGTTGSVPSGGGGVSTSPEDAALQKLAADLQAIHDKIDPSQLPAIDAAETNAQALNANQWVGIVYNVQTQYAALPTKQQNVVKAVQDMVELASYGRLESDTSTTDVDVQKMLSDLQLIAPSITPVDLNSFFDSFKSDIVGQIPGMLQNQVSKTTAVSTALEQAVSQNPEFAGILTNNDLHVTDLPAIYGRAHTLIDKNSAALDALIAAAAQVY